MWYPIHGTKHQILYGITDHLHHNRIISENDSMNGMLNIFQSDYDVISHYLNVTYNFIIIENATIFFFLTYLKNWSC